MGAYIQVVGKTDEWATPQWLFEQLDAEFHFTLDPCSTDENAKCKKHYTKDQDGLVQDWGGETVFCNPPYGREMPRWIQKCAQSAGGGYYSGASHSCENRHQGFSRVHLRESRAQVH